MQLDLKDRLTYELDNRLARGAVPAIVGLLFVVALIVLIATAALVATEAATSTTGSADDVLDNMWVAVTRALDPGTMASDAGWRLRAISLFVTLSGVLVVSALIGLVTNGIDHRLTQFRRGRTPVVEHDHVLVLGWSPKVPSIIQEQINARAHASERIVIGVLAQRDKLDMEQDVRREISIPRRVRLVFRTGTPANPRDLALMNPEKARSILVLSPSDDPAPDAQVVRACFGLLRSEHTPRPIVAEIRSSRNAEGLREASNGDVLPVVSSEVIARIAAQIVRYPGLTAAYERLLDFSGDEIYIAAAAEQAGRTYRDVVASYPKSSVIGLYRDTEGRADVVLCPSPEEVLRDGDQVVAVSKDATTVVADLSISAPEPPVVDRRAEHEKGHQLQEHLLVIGWSGVAPMLLETFGSYLLPGSTACITSVPELGRPGDDIHLSGTENLDITYVPHDDGDMTVIDALLAERDFDRIVILSYRRGLAASEADARTLLTLVHIRPVLGQDPGTRHLPVLVELQNASDIDLVGELSTEDFIVSDRLAGQMLSQLSVTPRLSEVFRELFEPWGADILLRPMADYVPLGEPQTYGVLVAAALEYHEGVIGYLREGSFGTEVVLNPEKSSSASFGPEDWAIVVVKR